jgi:hypothetical protein
MTAAACFEMLATCRLDRYEPNDLPECDYSITNPTQEQATTLRALGLTWLSRDWLPARRWPPKSSKYKQKGRDRAQIAGSVAILLHCIRGSSGRKVPTRAQEKSRRNSDTNCSGFSGMRAAC